jgi:hypothetical protein
MDNIITQLQQLESDQHRLEEIQKIEHMLKKVKSEFKKDYTEISAKVVDKFVDKLKHNKRIKNVVEDYIDAYVTPEFKKDATESLYEIMSAEYMEVIETLNHTSCNIS